MSPAWNSLRAVCGAGLFAALTLLGAAPAAAADFTVSGKVLVLSGPILREEWNRFRYALEREGEGAVSLVVLRSPGGDINSAGEIGRIIRAHRLTTLVDGASSACLSACTIVFAGGAQRIYLNPPGAGGLTTSHQVRGLGFHQGHTGRYADAYTNGGPSTMVKFFFNEFGVPAAADLVDKAPPDAIYLLSGQEALARGVATRLR